MERLVPSVSELLWGQAFNVRMGLQGTKMVDIYRIAADQNISASTIPMVPESDDFNYTVNRGNVSVTGKSMVCCVFVCNMWKHGGIFDDIGRDSVNCAELTNWDVSVSFEFSDPDHEHAA